MSAPIPDEQAALLAAIVAEPDEDTPRLVYADWLQENGDEEQATFIRDSIKLDHFEDHEDDQRERMAKRLVAVSQRNGAKWLGALGITALDAVYDRGMAAGVIYQHCEPFLTDAPVLFARVPVTDVTIHAVSWTDLEPEWFGILAEMPHLSRLRALRLSDNGIPVAFDGWERFITSPHLANLQELSVQEAGLTDDDVLWIERCEHLTNLEELDLFGNRLTVTGALSLVRSPRLPNLRRLILAHNYIVEDRAFGSLYLELEDALYERSEGTPSLDVSL